VRVLLLDGNQNQAVAAVRSLGAAGHRVTVGDATSWSKAGWSRSADRTFRYTSPRRDVNAFMADVLAECRREPGTFVLPMTESTALPVSARRAELTAAGARFELPSHESVLRAFDKDVTLGLAASLGVATPRSRPAHTLDEARGAAGTIGYPVVLKAASSERVVGGGAMAAGAPRYARTPEALQPAFEALRSRAETVLVQEFVPGRGAGYFALLDHGELRAEFAHRRIRDMRPTGSGSSLRESIAVDPVLRDPSLRILRALDWHGVAMVEYRLRADGTPVFMEVNGRFWNSLALAVHAGVDFPRLLVELADSRGEAGVPAYRTGVRCRWWLGDVRHVAEVLAGPPAEYPGEFPGRMRTLAAFLRPHAGTYHDNFMWSDPLPELGDWVHFLFRRVPGMLHGRRS
jgi:predicted ATP-grasp superfamily ATP-dependent carboligase